MPLKVVQAGMVVDKDDLDGIEGCHAVVLTGTPNDVGLVGRMLYRQVHLVESVDGVRSFSAVEHIDYNLNALTANPRGNAPSLAAAELIAVHLLAVRARILGKSEFDWRAWCAQRYPDVPGSVRDIERSSKYYTARRRTTGTNPKMRLCVEVESEAEPGLIHPVGMTGILVESLGAHAWLVEVRVPDDTLEGGAWYDTLELDEYQFDVVDVPGVDQLFQDELKAMIDEERERQDT